MQDAANAGLWEDPLPAWMLAEHNLPGLMEALLGMHQPVDEGHAVQARERFAFQELLVLQLKLLSRRMRDRCALSSAGVLCSAAAFLGAWRCLLFDEEALACLRGCSQPGMESAVSSAAPPSGCFGSRKAGQHQPDACHPSAGIPATVSSHRCPSHPPHPPCAGPPAARPTCTATW